MHQKKLTQHLHLHQQLQHVEVMETGVRANMIVVLSMTNVTTTNVLDQLLLLHHIPQPVEDVETMVTGVSMTRIAAKVS